MADRYERDDKRAREVLDFTIQEKFLSDKRRMRLLFDCLHEQGFAVRGYKRQLEDALRYVNAALAAIDSIESVQ